MFSLKTIDASGFTLIELIVTAAIVASISVSVTEIFIAAGSTNAQARNLAIATQLAQQKLESDRNAGYSAIPATDDFTSTLPSYFGSPKSAAANFSDLSPADPGLKLLQVSISYNDRGKTKNVQASTLVAQKGIDR